MRNKINLFPSSVEKEYILNEKMLWEGAKYYTIRNEDEFIKKVKVSGKT